MKEYNQFVMDKFGASNVWNSKQLFTSSRSVLATSLVKQTWLHT